MFWLNDFVYDVEYWLFCIDNMSFLVVYWEVDIDSINMYMYSIGDGIVVYIFC